MKIKNTKLLIPFVLLILLVFTASLVLNNAIKERKRDVNVLLLPSLPKPIAKEYALITSAGQGTDAYVVSDAANKLMIHNYFMPQAEETDLEGVNTLVFVVGYSALGEKLHGTSYDMERKRVEALLEKAQTADMPVITVYLGSKHSREKKTEELLELVIPKSNYIIAAKEANDDGFLSELVRTQRIPMTLINGPKYVSEPFASAFR